MIDIAIVSVYLGVCVFIGFYKIKKLRNIREYVLGDGNVSTFVLASSFFATAMGAGSCIGAIAIIYKKGALYAFPQFFSFLYWVIMGQIFSRDLSRFRKFISLSEIMSFLYGKVAGWISSAMIIINGLGVIAVQMTALGHVAKYFFSIDYAAGALVGGGVILLYSFYGGFKPVVMTDFFQTSLFFVALPIACGFLLKKVGNFNLTAFVPLSTDVAKKDIMFSLGSLIYLTVPSIGAPYLQRVLSSRSTTKTVSALRWTSFLVFIYSCTIIIIGLVLRAQNLKIVPEQGFLYIISTYLPGGGMRGVIVAAIFAICMSTADSWLNTVSSVIAHDIVKPLFPTLKRGGELVVARSSVVMLTIVAAFFSLSNQDIMEKIWVGRNFWHPIVLIPLLVGVLGIKVSRTSFMYSFVFGTGVTLVGRCFTSEFGVISLGMGTVASAGAFFGHHYFTSQKVIRGFFIRERVKNIFKGVVSRWERGAKPKDIFLFVIYAAITSIPFFIFLPIKIHVLYWGGLALRAIIVLTAYFVTYYCRHVSERTVTALLFMYFLCIWSLQLLLYEYSALWLVSAVLSLVCYVFFTNVTSGFIASVFAFFLYKILILIFPIGERLILETSLLCLLDIGMIMFFIFRKQKKGDIESRHAKVLGGSVVHDIRNPMNLLRGYIWILKTSKHTEKERIRTLKKMELILDGASNVIDKFLLYMKGHSEVFRKIKIRGVIEDVISRSTFSRDTQVALVFKENFEVKIDRVLFEQALINIIENAKEAVKSSKVRKIKITIEIVKSIGYIRIRDSGVGIEENKIESVFNSFYTDKEEGTGIGLAMGKQMLDEMGFSIRCESRRGKYTEFVIAKNIEKSII